MKATTRTELPLVADEQQPARDGPIIELRPVGDGRRFVRVLARTLVRRELIAAGLIGDPDACGSTRRTG